VFYLAMFILFTVDPYEHHNIAKDSPGVVRYFKAEIEAHRKNMVPSISFNRTNDGHPDKWGGNWTPGWCEV